MLAVPRFKENKKTVEAEFLSFSDFVNLPGLDPNFCVETRQEHPGLRIIVSRTNSLRHFNLAYDGGILLKCFKR